MKETRLTALIGWWENVSVATKAKPEKYPSWIGPAEFRALIVKETYETPEDVDLTFSIFPWEDKEIDRLTEEQFSLNYEQEYREICEQAKEEYYPYYAVGTIDDQQLYQYESYKTDDLLKKRWRSLRECVERQYVEKLRLGALQAMNRRDKLKPKYPTKAGFLVKSKGEQIVANTLFESVQSAYENEGRDITLMYEPLVRIPEEDRVVIPDFVLLEACLVVEYAGLSDRNYKVGLILKLEAFKKLRVPVILFTPENLIDIKRSLNERLRFIYGARKQNTN